MFDVLMMGFQNESIKKIEENIIKEGTQEYFSQLQTIKKGP